MPYSAEGSLRRRSEAVRGAPPAMRPRALIVSIYGLYARQSGGWLSVSALIRLLAELGVDEPAVRSSISRLKRRHIVEAERVDGVAGYSLSPSARQILARGDRRIYHSPRADLADGWVLAVFSVPEEERRMRHQLRSRLSGLGFGTVAPGVWIAPQHLADDAHEVLEVDDLIRYVDLFSAHYRFAGLERQVATWWDLDELAARYQGFLDDYRPVLERWRRRRGADHEAFAELVQAVTAWRRLPFSDPGLPAELLPRRWVGSTAATTFLTLHDRLEEPARRFVDSVRRD